MKIPKNFATCFYLAELNEVFLGWAKNEFYYLCLEIPLWFFVWHFSMKIKSFQAALQDFVCYVFIWTITHFGNATKLNELNPN